jgi:hypothetical protein
MHRGEVRCTQHVAATAGLSMLCGSVDIPEALLEAQLGDRLVVFVGAGASVPPPSDMPTFGQLVADIAAEAGVTQLEGEELDQCLGRIDEGQFPVHQAVWDRFAAEGSEPCALHHGLVGLYRTAEEFRLVTTNFDRHLSTAAGARWPEGVAEYGAPALPLGDVFNGIVYVHGSVDGDPSDLVVTDADFGQAYLTKGYARRFLLDCFREYVVLFVGYSHDDRIMEYLARGLPPHARGGPARFALAPADQQDKWKRLGIELIPYDPNSDPGEPHASVREALERWGVLARRDYVEHEQEVARIVALGPEVDRESQDYLRRQVRDPVTVAFFCHAAHDPAWLGWLEDEAVFRSIFTANSDGTAVHAALCGWFAERAVSAPLEAMDTVARMGGLLSVELWRAIAFALWSPRPPADVLLEWLPVLMRSAPPVVAEELSYILAEARPVEDDLLSTILLEFLTEPVVSAKPRSWTGSDGRHHDVELAVRGEDYWLAEALSKVFLARLDRFAADLLAIASRNLGRAHTLLEAEALANEHWDGPSFHRSAIEPHEQDSQIPPDWIDVLVDGAREAIDWAIGDDTELAMAYLRLWGSSPAPLLRRLAVHTVGRASWLDADAKLAWLAADDRVFSTALHHEVYILLASAYPNATDAGRRMILDCLDAGLPPDQFADDPDLRDRVLFDLLSWLHAADANDREVERRLVEISAKHPEFAPRTHPEMTHWLITGFVPPPSPMSTRELLDASLDEDRFFAALAPQEDKGEEWPPRSRRESLLVGIRAASIEKPKWSLDLARALSRREMWLGDVWNALIDAWGEAELTDEQWQEALDVIQAHRSAIQEDSSVARLLEDAIRHSPPRLPMIILPLAKKIAEEMLADARTAEPEPPWESANWIQRAVNEPAGRIMVFLLHAIALEQEGEGSATMPADYQRIFDAAVAGDSYADGLARAVLAGQLHFLFGRYRSWASESLMPLLDWKKQPSKALQAWQGFLTTGRLSAELADALLPYYESAFKHLDDFSELKESFLAHLAIVALYSSKSPLQAGWLARFLQNCSDDDLAAWTRVLGHQLRQMSSDSRTEAWRSWLADYWRVRTSGRPRAISPREGRELVGWIPDLPDVFVEACECASQMPSSGAERSFYHRFAKTGIAGEHPHESGHLLLHLLRGEEGERRFWACPDVTSVAKTIASTGAAQSDITGIKNELLRLGCKGASNIPNVE